MNYWGRVWWLFQLPREISSHHRWCIGGLPLCSGRSPWRWKYHSRIVTFTPAASLITISCVINEVGSSSGKVPALTWKVRWRRLRQLILSPMRIALRGKVPTLPNKKLILTLQTLLDQENALPNHSQLRVHCFLFHSKPEKRFFSGEWWS